ncbi:unnamed protein product [Schistocephalus solidus]|uniref:Tudor domain-containing protein n=1 Tax=Schistocephalus solidus TaxID=70667 RepID=A0A183SYC0_SCHSO|nr:unnamed protein product [Schistocephalus solidus]
MVKLVYLKRFNHMVCQLPDGMMARVLDNGSIYEVFAVKCVMEEDCVRIPTLFGIIFSATLMGMYREEMLRIYISYRTESTVICHKNIEDHCPRPILCDERGYAAEYAPFHFRFF